MRVRTSHARSKRSRSNRGNRSNGRRDSGHRNIHMSSNIHYLNNNSFPTIHLHTTRQNTKDNLMRLEQAVIRNDPLMVGKAMQEISKTDDWVGCYGHNPYINSLVGSAAGLGLDGVVNAFLENGMDPNAKFSYPAPDDKDRTVSLLSIAAKENQKSTAELLIEKGAKIVDPEFDPCLAEHQLPVAFAVEEKNHEMVKYLLSQPGVSPSAFCDSDDHQVRTYFSQAALNRCEDTMAILAEKGADVKGTLRYVGKRFFSKITENAENKHVGEFLFSILQRKNKNVKHALNFILSNSFGSLHSEYVESTRLTMGFAQGVNFNQEDFLVFRVLMNGSMNFAGVSVGETPITQKMLEDFGVSEANEAIVTREDIKQKVRDKSYRDSLLSRLEKCYNEKGGVTLENGVIDLVPLDEAAESGNLKVVKNRLERGVNPNEYPNTIYPPIVEAAMAGHIDVAVLLAKHPKITKGVVVDAIFEAVIKGNKKGLKEPAIKQYEELVSCLKKALGDINIESAKNGKTLLYRATEFGYVEEVQRLVKEPGIDINRKSNNNTPLMEAAKSSYSKTFGEESKDHIEIIKILLDAGANPYKYNNLAPVEVAAQAGSLEAIKLLLPSFPRKHYYSFDSLVHGSYGSKEWFEILRFLKGKGANLNSRDEQGNLVLSKVIDCTSSNIGEIKKEIDRVNRYITKDSSQEKEELFKRAQKEFCKGFEQVKFLARNGVFTGSDVANGGTIIHSLVEDDNLDIVGGKEILIRFFTKRGIGIDYHDDNGDTALHCAVSKNNLSIVKELVSAGASMNVGDKEGLTPLQVSRRKGYESICEFLEEQSAKRKPDTNLESSVSDKLPSSHPKER